MDKNNSINIVKNKFINSVQTNWVSTYFVLVTLKITFLLSDLLLYDSIEIILMAFSMFLIIKIFAQRGP